MRASRNHDKSFQQVANTAVPQETGDPPALSAVGQPRVPDHSLTVISGTPRERGRYYGGVFKEKIRSYKEIYHSLSASREQLRYAEQCGKAISEYSPIIMEELEGIAEGAELRLEEVVLLMCHEEMWYVGGQLPKIDHCTALAAGPPDTADGNTYVGQTWDWMANMYGLSSMLLWKRPEGPSLITLSYPGLWAAVGLNSAGIALCATSAWESEGNKHPRVGIPYYVLVAQMLYQNTLADAIEEAKRARQSGWVTLVLADSTGQLANVEYTPKELAVEMTRGHLARHTYGSRQLTRTPEGQPVEHTPKCQCMFELLVSAKGNLDRQTLQGFFGNPDIGVPFNDSNFTLDSMLFNCTQREAHVTWGTGGCWKTFRFDDN